MFHLFSSTFLPTTLNTKHTKLIKGTLDLKSIMLEHVCSKIKESEAGQSISQCACMAGGQLLNNACQSGHNSYNNTLPSALLPPQKESADLDS